MVLAAASQRPLRNQDVRELTSLNCDRSGAVLLRRRTARGQLRRRGEKRGTEYVRLPQSHNPDARHAHVPKT